MKIGTELEIDELDAIVGGDWTDAVGKALLSVYYQECLLASKPVQHLAHGSADTRNAIFH